MLELAAAEMAQAAALFVAMEKEIEVLKAKGGDANVIALKDTARWVGALPGGLVRLSGECNNHTVGHA
jgi:hypothetical protein